MSAIIFLIATYGCETQTLKKAELWCCQIVVLETTITMPWTAKITKKFSPKPPQKYHLKLRSSNKGCHTLAKSSKLTHLRSQSCWKWSAGKGEGAALGSIGWTLTRMTLGWLWQIWRRQWKTGQWRVLIHAWPRVRHDWMADDDNNWDFFVLLSSWEA